MNNRKKFKKIKIITFIFTLLACIITVYLNILIDDVKGDLGNLQTSIESSWKDAAHNVLLDLRYQLESEVASNDVDINDDEKISSWILSHSFFKDSEHVKSFSVINMGYSVVNNGVDLKMVIRNSNDIDNDLKQDINYQIDESFNINDKSVESIEKQIDNIATKISKNNSDYPYESIKKLLEQTLFEKEKVILSTSNDVYYDKDKMSYEICDGNKKLWVESIMIPNGAIGFNNEPMLKNNKDNHSYKKVIVAVAMDADAIMMPYRSYIDHLNNLLVLANVLNIIIMVISISFLVISFIRILQKYNIGGDTNAENNRNFYTIISSVLRVNGVGIK
jgi:hypothetical protein